jgi:hypothetical protein
VLFVAPGAPTEVELDGSAEVFGALNNPAACAELATDSVCVAGVKVSCGKADVEGGVKLGAAVEGCREVAPVLLVDEFCVCWLANTPFKWMLFVSDMIHLHVVTPRVDPRHPVNRTPRNASVKGEKGTKALCVRSFDTKLLHIASTNQRKTLGEKCSGASKVASWRLSLEISVR